MTRPIVLTASSLVMTLMSCLAAWAGALVLYTGGFDGTGNFFAAGQLYDPLLKTFSLTTGSMATARTVHAQAVLQDGRVLVAGGQSDAVTTCANPSAEVYDPTAGTFTATTGPLTTCRLGPTATTLQNGLVLVVGGTLNSSGGFATLYSAELYDPTTGLFTATGSMTVPRIGHTATLLSDGTVLIAGGQIAGVGSTNTAEIYNPTTGNFTLTAGTMSTIRNSHAAVLLDTGEVLVMGGYDDSSSITSAELYDPSTGLFSLTGSMTDARGNFWPALLPNGQVLVAGGQQQPSGTILSSAEVYTRTTQSWALTGSMITPPYEYTLYNNGDLLPDGTVLIAGGQVPPAPGGGCCLSTAGAELYDPLTGTFSATGSMALPTGGYGDPLIFVGGATPPLGKVQVRFHYSAPGSPGNWSDAKKVSSTGVITMGPKAMEGNLIVRPGDILRVGYDFKMPGKHPGSTLSFTQAKVRFSAVCTSRPGKFLFEVNMADKLYLDPLNSTAWYPSGDQSNSTVYQKSIVVPDLCGGGTMSLKRGGLFGALVASV